MMGPRSALVRLRQGLLSHHFPRPVGMRHVGPAVSFCFDDFPRTAYLEGGSILKAAGARGTFYAAAGLMNTRNHLGEHFHRQDLDNLLADGHELASHTFGHLSCRKSRLSHFQRDADKGYQALWEMTGRVTRNFSFPYGHVTLAAKRAIGDCMSSCRGIQPGVNGPVVDLNLLLANELYGDGSRFEEPASLLRLNAERGGWLIFYTHDVRPHPSSYGCTPAYFEKVVSLVVGAGIPIRPVCDLVALLEHPFEPRPKERLLYEHS